jgi:WD40 repeat protein
MFIFSSVAFAGNDSALSRDAQTEKIIWKSSQIKLPSHHWKHGSHVWSVAWSPDGKTTLTSTGSDIVLADAVSGEIIASWVQSGTTWSLTFSPDGKQVLSGSDDKSVLLRDTKTGTMIRKFLHNSSVWCVAFSPDGQFLLSGSGDKTAILWDAKTGHALHKWTHRAQVASVAFSPDGEQIITGSSDNTAVLRNTKTGSTIQTWPHGGTVYGAVFSPDGTEVLTGSGDGKLTLRKTQNGVVINAWEHSGAVYSVAFSRDGQLLLSGSGDKTAILRDAKTGNVLQSWSHGAEVYSVAISPGGNQVLTGSGDKTAVSREVSYRISYLNAIGNELRNAEIEYRSLPKNLATIQEKLEQEKPSKDEFESIVQFDKRVTKWNSSVEMLNSKIQNHYAKLGSLPLFLRAKAFERAISRAYGNPKLSEIRYDPETARFFATVMASRDPEFKRLISIPVQNDKARALKAQLESDANGLEIELRVTEQNELIWGQPRVAIDNQIVVAQFVDKDFVSPPTSMVTGDSQLKTITLPSLAPLPQVANVKVTEDPGLNKLQMEVLQKEREQAALAARQAEEKRLKDRLAELNRQSQTTFNDDLPGLISKLPAAKANPRLHVLAIGINDYADVPDVPFADRSAQQFAEISQKLLGAQPQNVIVLTDSQATLGRLLSRLNTLLNRLGPQDQLLFYYAGHGVPGKDGAGAYLLAQDGGPGSYEQPDLQLGQIYSVIAKSRVGQAKIFIDACFSGRSGKDSIVFEGIAPIVVKPKQSFPDSDRMAVMTAGRGDQFSNQDKGRGHRLFSYHLMRLILEDGVKLEIGQLHQRLRQRVLEDSRRIGPEFEQEPDFQGNGRMALLN